MSSNYCSLTLAELKSELRSRNAKVTGRKKELIERLESYDRNLNFGKTEQLQPEYSMDLPDLSKYIDVNTDKKLAPLNLDRIHHYLEKYDKKLDGMVISLYKEKYLCYMRLSSCDELDFVKSACRAEMKKSVTYTVDIALTKDGHIHEAQCECAAGMGPHAHCKHAITVLYACYMFNSTGVINVEKTCTEKLQSFHHVKKYMGSPLKTQDIKMPGSGKRTNSECMGKFDPRPLHMRNMPGYNSFFRNMCLNFKGISTLPLFQIIPPANNLAVSHDHDYLQVTPEDIFLEEISVSKISNEERNDVEFRTRGQARNNCWVSEREKRLQSSNFGRICKATEKTDFNKLAKTLLQSSHKKLKSEAILHGQKYEKEAIQRYENDTKHVVKDCGIFVSKEYPFLGSSPDGVVTGNLICEVKCPFSSKNKKISEQTVPYLKFSDGMYSLSKTHDYYYQIQGQLFCAERQVCDLIVYTLTDVKYVTVKRDNDFIFSMIDKLQNFYRTYFEPELLRKLFYKDY